MKSDISKVLDFKNKGFKAGIKGPQFNQENYPVQLGVPGGVNVPG